MPDVLPEVNMLVFVNLSAPVFRCMAKDALPDVNPRLLGGLGTGCWMDGWHIPQVEFTLSQKYATKNQPVYEEGIVFEIKRRNVLIYTSHIADHVLFRKYLCVYIYIRQNRVV